MAAVGRGGGRERALHPRKVSSRLRKVSSRLLTVYKKSQKKFNLFFTFRTKNVVNCVL